MRSTVLRALLLLSALAIPGLARAAEPLQLSLRDHRFTPGEVSAPANERFRIEVTNQDDTPAEFESSEMKIEKIVVPGGRISVMAGPLKPGRYPFADEYHPDTAKGTLTVGAPVSAAKE